MELSQEDLESLANQAKWMRRMVKELWSKSKAMPKNNTDLEFRCIDGKVSAHRTFLKRYCSVLNQAIDGIDILLDPNVVVVVPDFSVETVRMFLHLLYTGSVNVTNENEINLVREFGYDYLGFGMPLTWDDQTSDPITEMFESSGESNSEDEPLLTTPQTRKKIKIKKRPVDSDSDQDLRPPTPPRKPKQHPLIIKSVKERETRESQKDQQGRLSPNGDSLFLAHKPAPKGISESFLRQIKREMCKAIVGPSGPLAEEERMHFMEPDCLVGKGEEFPGIISDEDDSLLRQTFPNIVNEDKYIIAKNETPFGFKYVMDAPTSSLIRQKDDRMTYINMGKFYELILGYYEDPQKEIPHLGTVKTVVMVVFRGSNSPDEELKAWQHWHSKQTSSGFSFQSKTIIEADTVHHSGIVGRIEQSALNAIEIYWNPNKTYAKLNIAVQCLSTDFNDQKGVKGQPLHLQVDTYLNPDDPIDGKVVSHRGYAQIKVFRDKGAERKQRDEAKQVERLSQKLACKRFKAYAFQPSSEQTEFYSMLDTNQQPFMFKPASQTAVVAHSSSRDSFNLYGLTSDQDEDASNEDPALLSEEPVVKRPRTEERLMIYLKQSDEATYSPLHVVPTSVEGLINAIKNKYKLNLDIRNVYRKNMQGAVVKFDNDMVKFYTHAHTFTMELSKSSDEEDGIFDLILSEA